MRRLIVILPLVAVLACSTDDDFTPVDPAGPTVPTIGGTYSSPTLWRLTKTGPTSEEFICAGGITIANQVGFSFSGTFFLADPACGSVSGAVTGGSFTADGSIRFELTVAGPNSNFLTAAFGCSYVSGDQGVSGTLVGNQLAVQATTVIQCQDGQHTLVTQIAGSR